MTLWIFGDSFSRHFKYLPESWVERTARTLGQKVNAFSRPLTPIEHMFNTFNKKRPEFEKRDVVIITLTKLNHRWFFKDSPMKTRPSYSEKESQAYTYYVQHLTGNDSTIYKTYITNFLYNLNAFSKEMDLHTIIMGNSYEHEKYLRSMSKEFTGMHFANGVFCSASDSEWKDLPYTEFSAGVFSSVNNQVVTETINNSTVEWTIKYDRRLNHLTKTNHILLSDKILNNITNKEKIDLTTGLAANFLTKELLQDVDFQKKELFVDDWKGDEE